jgi:surface polysaccharide O-acyltransferase-like enzyme
MNSKNIKSSRIFYLDQLRALAIIAIIFVHVANLWSGSPADSLNWYARHFFNIIGRTGVPIFLMLSGALLLNKNYEIWAFMKKRFPRILNPFIFWMAIVIVFAVITEQKFHIFNSIPMAMPYIIKTFITNRWYVWILIGVYLAMPIINDFVKNRGLKGVEYFLLLWVITSLICSISQYYDISLNYLGLALFFFAGPLGYVLLGYYLRFKKFNYSPRKLMILGLIMFVSAILLKTFLTWNGWFNQGLFRYYVFDTKSFLYMDIFAFLQVIGFFMFFRYLNEGQIGLTSKISSFLSQGIIRKLTISLSKSSYGVYLNHLVFIDLIGLLGLQLVQRNALKWIPFLIIVILLVSWGTMVILDRIPYLKKITGYH